MFSNENSEWVQPPLFDFSVKEINLKGSPLKEVVINQAAAKRQRHIQYFLPGFEPQSLVESRLLADQAQVAGVGVVVKGIILTSVVSLPGYLLGIDNWWIVAAGGSMVTLAQATRIEWRGISRFERERLKWGV